MTEPREVIDAYIRECLAAQQRGESFTAAEHMRLIGFVYLGLLGMMGHKFCLVHEAKEDYARLQRMGAVRSERKTA